MFFDHYPYTNFHNVNLDWVLQAVKAWGQTVKANDQAFKDLKEANESFKAYVRNYLKDLDVSDEIDTKLDRMLAEGTLTPYFAPYVKGYVESWLASNVTPTTPAVDKTLSISNAAADAAATGEKIVRASFLRTLDDPELYKVINKNHILPGYRIQSACHALGYFFVCGGSEAEDGTGFIAKMSDLDFKDAEITYIQGLGHANDITYSNTDHYLYITTVGEGIEWGIVKINPNDFTDRTLITNCPYNTIGIQYVAGWMYILAPYRIYRTLNFETYDLVIENTNDILNKFGIPERGSQTLVRVQDDILGWVGTYMSEPEHRWHGFIVYFGSDRPITFELFPTYNAECQAGVWDGHSVYFICNGTTSPAYTILKTDLLNLKYHLLGTGKDLNDYYGEGIYYLIGAATMDNCPVNNEGLTLHVGPQGLLNTRQDIYTNSGRHLYRIKLFNAGTWGEWVEQAAEIAQIKEDLSGFTESNYAEIPFTQKIFKGSYIKQVDGKTGNSNKYARTSLIDKGNSYSASIKNTTYQMFIAYYDSTGDILTGTGYTGNSTYIDGNNDIVFPNETAKFGLSFRRVDQAELTDSDIEAITNAVTINAISGTTALNNVKGLSAEKISVDKSSGTIINFYIGFTTGEILSSSLEVKTLCLRCNPSETYKVRHPKSTRFIIASYVSMPRQGLVAQKVYDGRNEGTTVFTTDINAKWLAIHYYSSTGNNPLTSEETYDALKIEIVNNVTLSDTANCYTVNKAIALPTTFEEVYGLYDDLVTLRPDYVTKNALTSGTLTNYEYIFSSGNYNKYPDAHRDPDPEITKPTILLSSGIHGYERSAVVSLYLLMRDLCNNEYALTDLLNYVNIRVIPVGCPWGYTNNSRVNANGVNINRNFATSTWSDYAPGEPGSTEYAGPSAGSENETKIIQNWMQAHSDALFYIDFHNSNFMDEIVEISGPDTEECTLFKKHFLLTINRVIPYWQNERDIDSANNKYCYTGGHDTIQGRTSRYYAYEVGIHLPFSCETSWNINGTGKHSIETFLVGAEAMGNFLVGMKKYYEDI